MPTLRTSAIDSRPRHIFRHPVGRIAFASLLLYFLTPSVLSLQAEHTRTWRQASYEDFLKGTPHGVAVRSDGRLELAPKFALVADADASYLWSLRVDPKGSLYAAGGSPAKDFRFDGTRLPAAPTKPVTIFESTDLAAQTIAFDSKRTLYVGTAPDGKVYRVSPAAEALPAAGFVLYQPSKGEVTALTVAPDGEIYAAAIGEKQRPSTPAPTTVIPTPQGTTTITGGAVVTGGQPQGQTPFIPFPQQLSSAVYRLSADGAPEELWNSREDVVYSLALASDGPVLVG